MKTFTLVSVAVAVALAAPAGAAGLRTCVPAGATALASAAPHQLYRYLRGPITACQGSRTPAELGGWADDSKPPLPWPRTTRVVALQGDCAALSDFQATAYGGSGGVTAFNLRTGTSWPLGAYGSSALGGSQWSTPVFAPDCSATWTVTETGLGANAETRTESVAAPADAATLSLRPGSRPRLRRATLTIDRSQRVRLRVNVDRAPRAVTAVVAGVRIAVRTTAQTTTLTLPRRRLVAGWRYVVTIVACDDGCATSTTRVRLLR